MHLYQLFKPSERSMPNFSLQNYYIVKYTGQEKQATDQQSKLTWTRNQILLTSVTGYVWGHARKTLCPH